MTEISRRGLPEKSRPVALQTVWRAKRERKDPTASREESMNGLKVHESSFFPTAGRQGSYEWERERRTTFTLLRMRLLRHDVQDMMRKPPMQPKPVIGVQIPTLTHSPFFFGDILPRVYKWIKVFTLGENGANSEALMSCPKPTDRKTKMWIPVRDIFLAYICHFARAFHAKKPAISFDRARASETILKAINVYPLLPNGQTVLNLERYERRTHWGAIFGSVR